MQPRGTAWSPPMSQSVPRDGGYCNRVYIISSKRCSGCLNPSRGTGGTATDPVLGNIAGAALSQSVPRDGGYCN